MDSKLWLRSTAERLRRVIIGPRRSTHERWLSGVGAVVGALLAAVFGVGWLAYGMATDPFWQAFPPPVAPFVLLPLAAGAVAGLRFTTDLVRPPRLSWKRLLVVTVGVLGYVMTTLTAFAMLSMALGNGRQNPLDLASNVAVGIVLIPVMAAVWTVIPGVLLAPFMAPFVGVFAFIMRRLGSATSRASREPA
jgi:hypothetical protein